MNRAPQQWQETDQICAASFDEHTIFAASPAIEHERALALFDLLETNRFRFVQPALAGPYRLRLAMEGDERLILRISGASPRTEQISIGLRSFRRVLREYLAICDSYHNAIKRLSPVQIETLDMARRAIHDEGAEALNVYLRHAILMDKPTSRRLFSLLCVLHIRR